MMTTPALKTCASCNAERPTAQFLPTRISDDGLTDSRRACDYGHTEWDWRERGRRVRLERSFVPNTRARTRHGLLVRRPSEAIKHELRACARALWGAMVAVEFIHQYARAHHGL